MKSVLIAVDAERFDRVLALYSEINCRGCDSSGSDVATNGLHQLWSWWLSDELRKQIGAHTHVDLGSRSDKNGLRIVFECDRNAGKDYQPIFIFISQHGPGKQAPHNQLQIPHPDIGKGQLKNKAVDNAIRIAAARCYRVAEKYHYRGKSSISLDTRLSGTTVVLLQAAIIEMARAICEAWNSRGQPQATAAVKGA